MNTLKVNANAENFCFWYKHKLADFYVYAIHWCKLHQWLSAACLCYTSVIHCFSSLTLWIRFWALLRCFPDISMGIMNIHCKFHRVCSSFSWDIVVGPNKICPDERTNERSGRTARKHNAPLTLSGMAKAQQLSSSF